MNATMPVGPGPTVVFAPIRRMDAPDYRRLFESAPALTLVLDRELRIVAASDAFLAATLTTRDTVIGEPLFRVFPSNSEQGKLGGEPVVRPILERALREGAPQSLALHRYTCCAREAASSGATGTRT